MHVALLIREYKKKMGLLVSHILTSSWLASSNTNKNQVISDMEMKENYVEEVYLPFKLMSLTQQNLTLIPSFYCCLSVFCLLSASLRFISSFQIISEVTGELLICLSLFLFHLY